MLSARIKDAFSTTSARLSALYTVLLVASFALTGTLTWWLSQSAAERELRDRISLEHRALLSEAKFEGLHPIIEAIRARDEQPGSLDYLFLDRAGQTLAGNLPKLNLSDGWTRLNVPSDNNGNAESIGIIAFAFTLPDGSRLAIGGDLGQGTRVRDEILLVMVWVGAFTLVVGVVTGVVATRRMLERVRQLDSVISRVTQGDLAARVPQKSAQATDDIERLGLGVNIMLDRIAKLVASVQRISSDIAHELRTPLSHLQQKLEDATLAVTVGESRSMTESAQAKLHDVLRTFDAILRLAEIEVGRGRTRFSRVALAPLVERVVDAYRPDVEASGRRLSLLRLDSVEICGDTDLLSQAVANLIENAMRHTPSGTAIRVEMLADGTCGNLSISDNGGGVPASERERLLEPFVRLDSSRSTPGAGLGLSIVAAVVKLHGADLSLDDAGPGLAVSIEFDLSRRVTDVLLPS